MHTADTVHKYQSATRIGRQEIVEIYILMYVG